MGWSTTIRDKDGNPIGIACGRGRRPGTHQCSNKCGRVATRQCDWALTGKKKGKTCDRWLCATCATRIGPNTDLCPPHARKREEAKAELEALAIEAREAILHAPDACALWDEATCRVCGCTDDDCSQCVEKTGAPCSWVEPDLCSACVPTAAEKNRVAAIDHHYRTTKNGAQP